MKRWMGFILVIGLTAGLAYTQPNLTSVAGKWTMSIAEIEHHQMSIVLELKQEGTQVTGNLVIPDHGDLEIVGDFADGKIRFSSTENGYMQVKATGKINEDGTLAGNLSSPMGNMAWTAKRAAAQ